MGIRLMISVYLGIILVYQASSMELLRNYKLWDSIGNSKVYDYSGNHCHGILAGSYFTTDRGIANYGTTSLWFNNDANGGSLYYKEVELSFWLFTTVSYSFDFYLDGSKFIRYDSVPTVIYSSFDGTRTTDFIEGWNFHTILLRRVLNQPGITYVDIYLNLSPIPICYFQNADTLDIALTYFYIKLSWYVILYEVWVHAGVSSIADLSSLFTSLSECGCNYNCPKTPKITCLGNHDRFKNFDGGICPTTCTSRNVSCDTKLDCIWKSKSSCIQGFYHFESKECLFYCPEDSCIYSYNPNYYSMYIGYYVSEFSFSCKKGYKKASDNPPACVPESWILYHRVIYSYVYDSIEEGYTLDSLGNCCICDEDYITVSINPLVCIYLPDCLAYEQVGSNYICSVCAKGYMTDSIFKCNKCDEEYHMISESPITCALRVKNCTKYLYEDTQWICEECNQGYKISNQGQCDQCQAGYLNIGSESLICKLEISKCIEYEISSDESICSICETGYSLDSTLKCTECEAGYIRLPQGICTKEITKCQDYGLYLNDWICIMCKD